MANENLYLIGTHHGDLDGPRRLEGLLRHTSPDIVALEFHKDREPLIKKKRRTNADAEKKEIDDVLREVGLSLTQKQKRVILEVGRNNTSIMGYEFKVSKAYTDTNPGVRLEYIDISIFENGVQEFVEGYIAIMKSMLAAIAQEAELREPFLEMLNRGKKAFLQQSRKGVDMIYKNVEMMEDLAESMRDSEIVGDVIEETPPKAIEVMRQIYNPRRDEAMASEVRKLYNGGNKRLAAVVGLLHIPGLKSRILDLDPTVMTLADYDSISTS